MNAGSIRKVSCGAESDLLQEYAAAAAANTTQHPPRPLASASDEATAEDAIDLDIPTPTGRLLAAAQGAAAPDAVCLGRDGPQDSPNHGPTSPCLRAAPSSPLLGGARCGGMRPHVPALRRGAGCRAGGDA